MTNRVLAAVAVAALLLAFTGAIPLWQAHIANRDIAALAGGHDVPAGPAAPEAVLAARGRYLIGRSHTEAAQAIADRIAPGPDQAARAALLYALGNAHLHHALSVFKIDPMKKIVPIINLAKSEYRQSLQLDPGDWDARYNLDIAMSLVRDADPPPPTKGETMAGEKPFWPNVPGTPNGQP